MAVYSPAAQAAANRGEIQVGPGKKLTVIGWIAFLMILYMINKTKTGHVVIYWGLVAVAIFLLIGNYKRIVPILEKGVNVE